VREQQERGENPTRLMTVDEVARELSVGRTFVWELTAAGRLPTVRLGRLVRIRPEDLRRYVDQLVQGDGVSSDELPGSPTSGRGRRRRVAA
jgi:excisionase family DNA binding protein